MDVCDYLSAQALGVGKQSHEALVMPMLGSSLARLPQLPEELLHRGGRRLQSALKHMHEAGLVHADVKSDNCMVSEKGHWYLGDFGSSLPIGDKITYATVVSLAYCLELTIVPFMFLCTEVTCVHPCTAMASRMYNRCNG